MGINPDAVGATGKPTTRSWTFRDSLLYAVGIGAGAEDPFASELEFTTHNSKEIEHRAFPTQGVVIGFGAGGAMAHAGDLDWGRLLHGSQGITVHRPIPPRAASRSPTALPPRAASRSPTALPGCGTRAKAAMRSSTPRPPRSTPTAATCFLSCAARWSSAVGTTVTGGFGGEAGSTGVMVTAPDTDPDYEVVYQTRSDQALTYRLSGDYSDAPEPAAQRSVVRHRARWLPQADPARAVHLRLHRPRVAAHSLRG